MQRWASQFIPNYQSLRKKNTFRPDADWTYFYHRPFDELAKRGITKEWYDGCFKFAFVRNTWDRLVSLYEFERIRRHKRARRKASYRYTVDFEMYIRHLCCVPNPSWPRYNNQQMAWLKHGVDFVGRFERIDEDWETLCGIIGMGHIPLGRHNVIGRPDYKEYYTKELRKIVAEHFADEITEFGFEFRS